ncbi:hypothetical protein IE81DRAFT_164183 [Ceraceosorus guamensis]|uniref:Secreted protein n=1 Tax=Ceraceosorus guamensis TaxID=1522189 RepID=A0A316W6S8_9BASI|nr:hypothetical protein IE81DRAFT_164183 [Ceraceosorus guamensis]PWN45646.1 hypothetical protein IE81DRAFT_164183 [Ceraceosorus guamensis]
MYDPLTHAYSTCLLASACLGWMSTWCWGSRPDKMRCCCTERQASCASTGLGHAQKEDVDAVLARASSRVLYS